jgi:hypothetical protein
MGLLLKLAEQLRLFGVRRRAPTRMHAKPEFFFCAE